MAKQWTFQFKGHEIRVRNEFRRAVLEVDGLIADESTGILSTQCLLIAPLYVNGQTVAIEARIGTGSFRMICHILVDGKLVGGDTEKEMNFEDGTGAETGMAVHLLKSIFTKGLMFAIIMGAVGNDGDTLWSKTIAFAIRAVGFGGFMGLVSWRATKHAADKRRKRLEEVFGAEDEAAAAAPSDIA